MSFLALLLVLTFIPCLAACAPDQSGGAAANVVAESVKENSKPDVSLANTYWKLVQLNGGPVDPGEGKELHMILKGDDQVGGYMQ